VIGAVAWVLPGRRLPSPALLLLFYSVPMILLTKAMLKQLPPLYATEGQAGPLVIVKFFYPDFSWTWYGIEFDGKDMFYGYVDGDFPELGYFFLTELKCNRGKLGCTVERDSHFAPCQLSQIQSVFSNLNRCSIPIGE
jgi:hypothetical protein